MGVRQLPGAAASLAIDPFDSHSSTCRSHFAPACRRVLLRHFGADDQGQPPASSPALGLQVVVVGGVAVASLCAQLEKIPRRILRPQLAAHVSSGHDACFPLHHLDAGRAVDPRSERDADRVHGPSRDAVFAVLHDRRKDYQGGDHRHPDGAGRRGMAHRVRFLGEQPTLLGDITCFVSMLLFSFFLFAGALAYFLYGEVPRPVFYAAGALVVGGAIVVIHAMAATAEGERAAETASTPEV